MEKNDTIKFVIRGNGCDPYFNEGEYVMGQVVGMLQSRQIPTLAITERNPRPSGFTIKGTLTFANVKPLIDFTYNKIQKELYLYDADGNRLDEDFSILKCEWKDVFYKM